MRHFLTLLADHLETPIAPLVRPGNKHGFHVFVKIDDNFLIAVGSNIWIEYTPLLQGEQCNVLTQNS